MHPSVAPDHMACPRLTMASIWLYAAPAQGQAHGPWLHFLGGQRQDLHGASDLGGFLQTQEHQVVAVVIIRAVGVWLQEAHVEIRVREALADVNVLASVFIVKQVVAAQPDLVMAESKRSWRG